MSEPAGMTIRATTPVSQLPWYNHYVPGVPPSIEYPPDPLPSLLETAASVQPDRTASICFEGQFSYAETVKQARKFAHALGELGIGKGDRIGVLLPNVPEYISILFGAWMAGATVVQFSPLMVEDEINKLVCMTECSLIVSLDVLSRPVLNLVGKTALRTLIVASLEPHLGLIERWLYPIELYRRGVSGSKPDGTLELEDLLKNQPDTAIQAPLDPATHPALIQATGGTTGSPKGVVLTHRNLIANTMQLGSWYNDDRERETRVLAVVPFFHCYGLTVAMLGTIALGGSLILCPKFSPRTAVKLISRYKPTMLPGVPALYSALNEYLSRRPIDLSCIEICVSGASGLPSQVRKEFEGFGAKKLIEGYGLSEASPVTHVNPVQRGDRQGTIGLPLPDTFARIVDLETGTVELGPNQPGELLVKGPQIMAGYLDDEETTAEVLRDGWLHTGDIATYDEDGYFSIVDRKKDLIKTSGYNVFPIEVEAAIRLHDAVADVAVVGVADAQKGELVKAYVIPKDGSGLQEDQLEKHCKEQLAKHKQPKIIELCDELPRNFLGKVLRRELRNPTEAER